MRWMTSLVLLLLPVSVQARDWPSAGPFTITDTGDACGIIANFPNPEKADVQFLILYDGGEKVIVQISSLQFYSDENKAYSDVGYSLNGRYYSGPTMGITRDELFDGFLSQYDRKFLDDFAATDHLDFVKFNQEARLDWTQGREAVATLEQCVAQIKDAPAAN